MYAQISRIVEWIAMALAILAGAVLLVIVVLTCVSIIGRALVPFDIGLGPIRGIYDLTEIGMAAAIFGFLPWAQFNEAHARVDLLEPIIPRVMDRLLDLVFNIGMFAVATVGTWRLYLGMLDKYSYGETTLIAQIPVWQGYAAGMVGGAGFIIVSAFCIFRATRRLARMPV